MTPEDRDLLRIASLLLLYPDGDFSEALEAAANGLRGLPDSKAKRGCEDMVNTFRRTPHLQLKEHYTQTFDMTPATSLHLSFHRWGDGEARGNALAHLRQIYRNEGYECVTEELPDFLPMMLEFFSLCREETRTWLMGEYGRAVATLASGLRESGSPYAALLEGLLGRFFEMQAAGDE